MSAPIAALRYIHTTELVSLFSAIGTKSRIRTTRLKSSNLLRLCWEQGEVGRGVRRQLGIAFEADHTAVQTVAYLDLGRKCEVGESDLQEILILPAPWVKLMRDQDVQPGVLADELLVLDEGAVLSATLIANNGRPGISMLNVNTTPPFNFEGEFEELAAVQQCLLEISFLILAQGVRGIFRVCFLGEKSARSGVA
jgi:hypothetical protein